MIERQQPYARQLHVCINNRNGESKSCGYDGSEEVLEDLRKVTKERNLKGKVRIGRSGCFDVCAFGPNMMIWPEGLMKVTNEDVPQIVDKYLSLQAADQAMQTVTRAKSALAHFRLKLFTNIKCAFAEQLRPCLHVGSV